MFAFLKSAKFYVLTNYPKHLINNCTRGGTCRTLWMTGVPILCKLVELSSEFLRSQIPCGPGCKCTYTLSVPVLWLCWCVSVCISVLFAFFCFYLTLFLSVGSWCRGGCKISDGECSLSKRSGRCPRLPALGELQQRNCFHWKPAPPVQRGPHLCKTCTNTILLYIIIQYF